MVQQQQQQLLGAGQGLPPHGVGEVEEEDHLVLRDGLSLKLGVEGQHARLQHRDTDRHVIKAQCM